MELAINICQTSVICFLSVLVLARIDDFYKFPKWLGDTIAVLGFASIAVMMISALYIVWA